MIKKSCRVAALASGLALAGCAPVTFAPGTGLGVQTGPGLGLSLTTCSPLGVSSQAAGIGSTSSLSARVAEIRNRISALHARFSPSYRYSRADVSSWKRIATGECR